MIMMKIYYYYITTILLLSFNTLISENFTARLVQQIFRKKIDFDNKLKNFNKSVISNKKNKYLLKLN